MGFTPVLFRAVAQPQPLFEGRRKNLPVTAAGQASIDTKTAHLRDELEALARWDVAEHRTPVLQRLDIAEIVQTAREFLTKQAQTPPHVPYPFMIGITGKTASGKTTVTDNWLALFNDAGEHRAEEIKLDMYYHNFAARRARLGPEAFFAQTNLDSPRAQSLGYAQETLADLKNGYAIRAPQYNFPDASRYDGVTMKAPLPFVMVEGLFALHTAKLRNLMELRVFIDIDPQTQHQRWWDRATARTPDASQKANQSLFDQGMAMESRYITPQKQYANVVINGAVPRYQNIETMRRLTDILHDTFYPEPVETKGSLF